MDNQCLYDILINIINSPNDSNYIYNLIAKFEPLLNKLSYQLNYDCAKTDLIIFLIEFSRKLSLKQIENFSEGEAVKYIERSLRNKAIDLHRKMLNQPDRLYTENIIENSYNPNLLLRISLKESIEQLTLRQADVIIKKYILGYSDSEIASQLNISRQAVNKIKTKALLKLKTDFVYWK